MTNYKSNYSVQRDQMNTNTMESAEIHGKNSIFIYRMPKNDITNNRSKGTSRRIQGHTHKIVKNDLNNDDIHKMVNEILVQEKYSQHSSIFMIVPASDDDDGSPYESTSSTICLQFSKSYFKNNSRKEIFSTQKRQAYGLKLTYKSKSEHITNNHLDQDRKTNVEKTSNSVDHQNKEADINEKIQSGDGLIRSQNNNSMHYKRTRRNKELYNQIQITDIEHVTTDLVQENLRHRVQKNIPKQVYGAVYSDKQNEYLQLQRQITGLLHEGDQSARQISGGINGLQRILDVLEHLCITKKEIIEPVLEKETHSQTCQVDFVGAVTHLVSMDTTEDRPCCCVSKEPSVTFVENIASEIMQPMIASQGVALALSHEAYQDMKNVSRNVFPQNNNTTRNRRYDKLSKMYQQTEQNYQPTNIKTVMKNTIMKSNQSEHTVCNQAPCENACTKTNTNGSHNQYNQPNPQNCQQIDMQLDTPGPMDLTCYSPPPCQPNTKSDNSVALCDNRDKCSGGCDLPLFPGMQYSQSPPIVPMVPPLPPTQPICIKPDGARDTYNQLPCDHKSRKKQKVKCTCGSKESEKCPYQSKNWKKCKSPGCSCTIRNTQTPPGLYSLDMMTGPSSALQRYAPGYQRFASMDFGHQCAICDESAKEDARKNKCTCKSKRGKKIIVCECPYEPPPPPSPIEYKYVVEVDEKEERKKERKYRSNMTQTISGFNIRFKKRPIVDEEMSFEDAIRYYDELEGRIRRVDNYDQDDCSCKIEADCECPYDPLLDQGAWDTALLELSVPFNATLSQPELKGLKVSVEGKGSSSKGLAGVRCFERCFNK